MSHRGKYHSRAPEDVALTAFKHKDNSYGVGYDRYENASEFRGLAGQAQRVQGIAAKKPNRVAMNGLGGQVG
jgi:hypothetical protein